MKLYGSYTSPFVRHCRVALAQENLAFEFIETDYALSAEKSPTAKVPFLTDGELMLTDSSVIVKYAREKSGKVFPADIEDYEIFAMTNTVLDSAINVFLLENENFGADQINYIARQQNRIASGLTALNAKFAARQDIDRDGALRCACFLGWAVFRNRVSLAKHDNLRALLDAANRDPVFAETAPR